MDNNAAMKFFKPLTDYWDKLEKKRKITYASIAAGVLLLIIILVLLLNRTHYTVLYSSLSSQEAGQIMTRLNELEINAKARGTSTILVPEELADSLRMQLSSEGYPQSGLNYDMFEKSTGFGTTDYEKQKYMQFQIQERLQGSIKALDNVEDAIVNLNIPDNSAFVLKSSPETASASVILRLKNGAVFTAAQAQSIIRLVATSVPGLEEDNVHIMDSQAKTLNPTDSTQADVAGTQLQLENEISNNYKEKIEEMLAPVLGETKFVVSVRAELDFDSRTTESIVYSPTEGTTEGVPVSVNEEKEKATGAQSAGNVGMDPNGCAPEYPTVNSGDGGSYETSKRTVNYEINQTRNIIQRAGGVIDDLSVSVILDSQDLQPEAENKVRSLVAGAAGIDPENVIVETMSFSADGSIVDNMLSDAEAANRYMTRQAFIRNAIIFGIIGLIILCVILALVHARNKKKKEELEQQLLLEAEKRSEGESKMQDAIESADTDDMSEMLKEKKSDKRKLIESNISQNPEFVVQLLRNWLDEYNN